MGGGLALSVCLCLCVVLCVLFAALLCRHDPRCRGVVGAGSTIGLPNRLANLSCWCLFCYTCVRNICVVFQHTSTHVSALRALFPPLSNTHRIEKELGTEIGPIPAHIDPSLYVAPAE